MRGLTLGMPKPARVVKILLLINILVFVLQMFLDIPSGGRAGPMSRWLGVTVGGFWQVWRYLTFQFLHGGFWHIVLNMLGLYMLGSPLENRLGTRRFLAFYLSCGVVAGIAYVVIGTLGGLDADFPIIGASGGVYGIVLAGAVFFPHFRIIFVFFPVQIRLAALIIFGGMILLVMQAAAAGETLAAMSDVAHLGGAVAAAFWIWVLPRMRGSLRGTRAKLNQGAWERKMGKRRADQGEIDRILDKIQREGLNSLSRKERSRLREATRNQHEDERDLHRL